MAIKTLIIRLFATALLFGLFSCEEKVTNPPEIPGTGDDDQTVSSLERIKSVDVSFLPQIRASNFEFKDEFGSTVDALDHLQTKGINTVRLRLWYAPNSQYSSWAEVKDFADEIHSRGLKLWLSVHYSDTWADPGSQNAPLDWQNLSLSEMEDSVYNYTKRILVAMQPEYIQVGNEINPGFLWPVGIRSSTQAFHRLINAGIKAVRSDSTHSEIILHYAGIDGSSSFFNDLDTLDYDIVGLSLYPFWHGKDISNWESVLNGLIIQTQKPCIIVETAYPFSLGWNDWTNNIVGDNNQIMNEYPASPQGQLNFMTEINRLSLDVDSCLGWSYWAPEWVSFNGSQSSNGSSWENLCWWDFNGDPLPVFDVLELQ